MNGMMISIVVLAVAFENIAAKAYRKKIMGDGLFAFSFVSGIIAIIFYLISGGGHYNFNYALLPYSAAFALFYLMGIIGTIFAVAYGPVSLTSLVVAYSLVIPTGYGILFLGDKTNIFTWLGILFLLISLYLINYKREKMNVNKKWILFVTMAFFANAGCTISQKFHQIKLGDSYKNEFMLTAMFFLVVVSSVIIMVRERKTFFISVKYGGIFSALHGILNGLVNLLVMVLNSRMNLSVLFPTISSGGIVASYFLARWIYKERLSVMQNIGVIFGVISVILLNIH